MPDPVTFVFDLGKVLIDFDYGRFYSRLAPLCNVSADQIRQFTETPALFLEYEKGRISSLEFFEAIRHHSGYQGTYNQFAQFFGDIFSPIPPMIELLETVLHLGHAAFLFSNTNELAIRHVRQAYPFYARFTGHVLSYEHGAMKPDPDLYEVVESMTGRTGSQLYYLDDRPENIHTGLERGWRALEHQSPAQTFQVLHQQGLLPTLPPSGIQSRPPT